MNKKVTNFDEILKEQGILVYKTRGTSMLPMLRQNRDLVIIEQVKSPLKKYDVALYYHAGRYVLHRIIRAGKGKYDFRGDNCITVESGIQENEILGVLTGFVRNEKKFSVTDKSYLLYVKIWNMIYPVRFIYKKIKSLAGKLKRKLLK